jgi:hypothetical protein
VMIAYRALQHSLAGKAPLEGASQLLPALYSLPSNDFHDITTGSTRNGLTTLNAGVGYDLITGRGSPYANLVVAGLVSWSPSSPQPQPPPPRRRASRLEVIGVRFVVHLGCAQWNSWRGSGVPGLYQAGTAASVAGNGRFDDRCQVTGLRAGQTARFRSGFRRDQDRRFGVGQCHDAVGATTAS